MAELQVQKVDNFNDLDVKNPDHLLIVKGNRIQASCLSRFLAQLHDFFQEQNVISIRKPIFDENANPRVWRFVDHPLKVCFNNDTTVSLVQDWSGSDHGFHFFDFERILNKQVSLLLSIDVVGEVVWSSGKKHFLDQYGKDQYRISMKLQNLSGKKLWATLFGSYTVSNAFNGTKLFFNDDKVKEIVEFRDKFLETWDEQSSSSFSSLSKCVAYNMEKDFIEDTNYSFSAEVDSVNNIKDLIVVGTIVFIEPLWFYMACNHCTKIVQPIEEGDEASYHCCDDVCIKEKRVINPYPRFKMTFKVQDSAGTVDMTMFEGCAKQILKKTATDFFPEPISKAAAIVQALPM
ncbi:hypothetical protein SSX86_006746 [Deinandra increscens subsp. villosa]|uniref:Replication factor A C-terminal domain-containing protein n=1 Tax=Deinandra increscens subsp. villosa TaxID=3103831 RepID=A0AAP0DFW1_9ASTR